MSAQTILSTTLTSGPDAAAMFPRLTAEQIGRLALHGVVRPIALAEVLLDSGQVDVPFFASMSGGDRRDPSVAVGRPPGGGPWSAPVHG